MTVFFLRKQGFSIVFKAFHPSRPVFGHGAAGFGPESRPVEIAMPLQRPQFFKADFSDGEIQKKAVYKTIMPIKANPPHFIVIVTRVWPELTIIFRWFILGPTSHSYDGTI